MVKVCQGSGSGHYFFVLMIEILRYMTLEKLMVSRREKDDGYHHASNVQRNRKINSFDGSEKYEG